MCLKGYTNEGTYKKLKGIIETAAMLGVGTAALLASRKATHN